jgi:hypothetical protein
MVVDFAAQTAPVLWGLVAILVILALVIFASVDPDLAEVYFGDVQILVATLALAAVMIALMVPARVEELRALGLLIPGH